MERSRQLSVMTWLDENFLAYGQELNTLMSPSYSGVYRSVRQVLLIQCILDTIQTTVGRHWDKTSNPQLRLRRNLTIYYNDVMAWAGQNPGTYKNHVRDTYRIYGVYGFLKHRYEDFDANLASTSRRSTQNVQTDRELAVIDAIQCLLSAALIPLHALTPVQQDVLNTTLADFQHRISTWIQRHDVKPYIPKPGTTLLPSDSGSFVV